MFGFERGENLSLTFRADTGPMTTPSTAPPPAWPPAHDAAVAVTALSHLVRDTLAIATGLAAGGRRVDVTGLDDTVGLLCAKALDLPPEQGRAARAELLALLADLDALGTVLRSGRME